MNLLRTALAAAILCACAVPSVADNASHYGEGDGYFGRRTACGNIHRPGNTVAHRSLPCGTRVRITNTAKGKSGIVTVTDRGPFVAGRVWDLNSAFARRIGCPGVCNVKAVVLGR